VKARNVSFEEFTQKVGKETLRCEDIKKLAPKTELYSAIS
jgi:hypothetical protein